MSIITSNWMRRRNISLGTWYSDALGDVKRKSRTSSVFRKCDAEAIVNPAIPHPLGGSSHSTFTLFWVYYLLFLMVYINIKICETHAL